METKYIFLASSALYGRESLQNKSCKMQGFSKALGKDWACDSLGIIIK